MKTTFELPDELVRAIRVRAANEGRTLKELVADYLWMGLDGVAIEVDRGEQVEFPVIRTRHAATPQTEMTPDRVADILIGAEEI